MFKTKQRTGGKTERDKREREKMTLSLSLISLFFPISLFLSFYFPLSLQRKIETNNGGHCLLAWTNKERQPQREREREKMAISVKG